MTVKELIAHLQMLPQDAIVITSYFSDYQEIDTSHISLIDGHTDFEKNGTGLIRHHGHLMELNRVWIEQGHYAAEFQKSLPAEPEFVVAVCFY